MEASMKIFQVVMQSLNISKMGVAAIVSSMFVPMVGLLIYAYGAAYLSYCYNLTKGSANMAILWAILCFCFPTLYYPFYAIVLLPKCPMIGGGRR